MPQSPETGAHGVELITEALSHDGYLTAFNVEAIPTSPTSLLFEITVYGAGGERVVEVPFDLSDGFVIADESEGDPLYRPVATF